MDKFWSICAMPIGLMMCFAPALIVWWLTKDKEESTSEKRQERH